MQTKVIFRKFPNGDIIALFPEIPSDSYGHHCMSYAHIGQHSGASPTIPNTSAATPDEYADLLAELVQIGYDVKICRKVTRKIDDTRRANLKLTPKD